MKKWIIAPGFITVVLYAGDAYTEGNFAKTVPDATTLELPGERLNRLANDTTADQPTRAAAVFALFKHHVRPGDSLPQMRRALRNTGWVKEAKLYYFAFLSGWIPVDINFKDRTYSLHLFADEQGDSKWVIYFQLSGESDWGKWHEDGVAFLCGRAGSQGESRIKEFALCYPDGKIEYFKGR